MSTPELTVINQAKGWFRGVRRLLRSLPITEVAKSLPADLKRLFHAVQALEQSEGRHHHAVTFSMRNSGPAKPAELPFVPGHELAARGGLAAVAKASGAAEEPSLMGARYDAGMAKRDALLRGTDPTRRGPRPHRWVEARKGLLGHQKTSRWRCECGAWKFVAGDKPNTFFYKAAWHGERLERSPACTRLTVAEKAAQA